MKAFLTKAKQPMEQAFPGLYRVLRVLFIVGMVAHFAFSVWYVVRVTQTPNFNRNVSNLFAQRNVGFIALFALNWTLIPCMLYSGIVLFKKLGVRAQLSMSYFSVAPLVNLGRLSCNAEKLQRSLESFQVMSVVLLICMAIVAFTVWVESLGKKREESASASDSA